MSITSLCIVVAVGLLVAGCTPSPRRLCARKMELAQDQWGKMDPDTRRAGMKNCVDQATREKLDDPKKYACSAACVMESKNISIAADCNRKCL